MFTIDGFCCIFTLAPEDVLITIEVALVDNLDTNKIESVIDNIESKVREIIPYASPSKIYVEPERDISSSINKYSENRLTFWNLWILCICKP